MRIIKFRLIKDNKIISTRELKPNGIIDCPVDWDIACQFTGLLDKQGKEIYEGDIVNLKSQYETDEPIDTKSKVEFFNGSFRLDFHAMILNRAVLEYFKSNWSIEVIGNIYESKHLLDNNT